MATIKEIKQRRNSIESTSQITKAMKLVATVKLQRTKEIAEKSIPYFDTMYETMIEMLNKSSNLTHKFIKNSERGKSAIIVISSDRGLAGGYNSSVVKEFEKGIKEFEIDKDDILIYSLGAKARDQLKRKNYEIKKDYSKILNSPSFEDAYNMSKDLLNDFENGIISNIYILYTYFRNTVVHIPKFMKLLPITTHDLDHNTTAELTTKKNAFVVKKSEYLDNDNVVMNYEPNDDEILNLIIPKYITAIIFGAINSSLASENGARMTAMDNATNNANELIEELSIQYNRARQGAITQELTEIIAGANAI